MAKKIIPKPVYWTDFEDLCKRLWAEIWQYPETKKHGRNGQPQSGVDVYGRFANGYVGIQCKGKDDYSNQQLTEKEIDTEINKATSFQPPLSKFYFATTANRSTTIDAYIRNWDEKHRQEGNFEIHIFFWEDIADLIEENQSTFNWYVKGQGFRQTKSAALVFENGENTLIMMPTFTKRTKRYGNVNTLRLLDYRELIKGIDIYRPPLLPKIEINSFEDYVQFINQDFPEVESTNDPQPVDFFLSNMVHESHRTNLSVCTIRLKLVNTGTIPLEDFKIYLEFNNVTSCDSVTKRKRFFDMYKYSYNVFFSDEAPFKAEYVPVETVLVEGDILLLDKICFRTAPEETIVNISWKMVSRGYQDSGVLKVKVKPNIEEFDYIEWVECPEAFTPKTVYIDKYQY